MGLIFAPLFIPTMLLPERRSIVFGDVIFSRQLRLFGDVIGTLDLE
jgi:hypothetical protein